MSDLPSDGAASAIEVDAPDPGLRGTAAPMSAAELTALGAITLAFAVAAARALATRWLPASDEALMELSIRGVPGDLPLTGVYSRLGWNHPGPAQLLMLSVPYRLSGSASAALSAAMVIFHLGGLLVAWAVTRRIHRVTAIAVVVGLQLCALSVDGVDLRAIWNPYVSIVWMGTLLVAAWNAAERRPSGAVLVLPLATFLLQSHLAVGPVVIVIAASAIAICVLGHRVDDGDGTPRIPLRHWAIGAGVAALLWVPPLIDQIAGSQNLTAILSRDTASEETAGFSRALAALSHGYTVAPTWARPFEGVGGLAAESVGIPWLLVVPVAGFVVALRRRDLAMVRGLGLAAIASVAALISVAAMPQPLFQYLIVGQRSVAAVTIAIGAGALWRSIRPSSDAVAITALAASSVALSIVFVVSQWGVGVPAPAYQDVVQDLSAAMRADIAEHVSEGDDVIVSTQVGDAMGAYTALRLQLDRHGVSTLDGGSFALPAGPGPVDADAVEYAVVSPDVASVLQAQAWEHVVEHQPFSAAEQTRLSRLNADRDAIIEELRSSAPGSRRHTEVSDEEERLRTEIDELTENRIALSVVRRG